METYIRNKMAQIYALVFVVDYPSKVGVWRHCQMQSMCVCSCSVQWPHFFANLLGYVQSAHSWSVDLYLRVLLAIDSEVVDRQVVHSQEVCRVGMEVGAHGGGGPGPGLGLQASGALARGVQGRDGGGVPWRWGAGARARATDKWCTHESVQGRDGGGGPWRWPGLQTSGALARVCRVRVHGDGGPGPGLGCYRQVVTRRVGVHGGGGPWE